MQSRFLAGGVLLFTTAAGACTGTTHVCGPDHTCQACTTHSQCTASNVCLPDGSCSDGSNVAYVSPTGTDNTMCTKAMPCTTVLEALGTNRPYIKFSGTIDEQVSVNNKTVTLLADPGAKLTYTTNNGAVLTAMGASDLKIYDLEITGASGATTGIGISIPAGSTSNVSLMRAKVSQSQFVGISASGGILTVTQSVVIGNAGGGISVSGGMLTVTQSTISGNAGGGISVSSVQFTITNNFIVKNGTGTSAFGGVLINHIDAGRRTLDFNTITGNTATSGTVTGVVCSLVTQAITFSNNIVYGNEVGGGGTQVGGKNCSYTFSDVGPDTVTGVGNINANPRFVSAGRGDYHIISGSPCKDAADPAAKLDLDVDGDARPQGARRDMGADEYR